MRCEAANDLLQPYMDGELDRRAAKQLTAHLRVCASCRSRLEERMELVSSVREALLYRARSHPRAAQSYSHKERFPKTGFLLQRIMSIKNRLKGDTKMKRLVLVGLVVLVLAVITYAGASYVNSARNAAANSPGIAQPATGGMPAESAPDDSPATGDEDSQDTGPGIGGAAPPPSGR